MEFWKGEMEFEVRFTPQKDVMQAGGNVFESLGVVLQRSRIHGTQSSVAAPGAVSMGEVALRKPPWRRNRTYLRNKSWKQCSEKEGKPASTAQWEHTGQIAAGG